MNPLLLTAVLLLVDVLDTGTVVHGDLICPHVPSCGDGWKEVFPHRCVKLFFAPKSFSDAQKHCRSLNSDLTIIEGPSYIRLMTCLTELSRYKLQSFWIGVKKTPEGKFQYVDGSEFFTPHWPYLQLDRYRGKDACVMMDFKSWTWMTARCSEKKPFVCIESVT